MPAIIILLGIIAIGLFGGNMGANNNGLLSSGNGTPTQKTTNLESKIKETQYKIDELQKQLQAEEEKKNASIYKGEVSISNVYRSTDSSQEYITLKMKSGSEKTIPITGWKVKSLSTGNSVYIPKGTYLFFTGTVNSEETISLVGGDTVYLVTGSSPNGASFKVNKCSGYLSQFQNFTPYLNLDCPAPRDENLSSIPKLVINDKCFDHIEYFPRCRIQTDPLPQNWSTECYNFIYDKINYPSCINTHKSDWDFYKPEWRVYLRYQTSLWKGSREAIVLYDAQGKVVDTYKY